MKMFLGIAIFVVFVKFSEATITAWSAPTIATADGSADLPTVAEDTTGVLATVTATSGGTVSGYAIAEQPNSGQFTITSGGEISIVACSGFDLDAEGTEPVLKISATDADGTVTATMTVKLTSVNEAPVFAYTQATMIVNDCLPAGAAVTTYAGADPESGTLACTIKSGDSSNYFTMAATGAITVTTGKTLSAATVGSYTLVVECADDASPALTGTSTLTLCVGSSSNCPSTNSGVAAITGSLVAMLLMAIGTISLTD